MSDKISDFEQHKERQRQREVEEYFIEHGELPEGSAYLAIPIHMHPSGWDELAGENGYLCRGTTEDGYEQMLFVPETDPFHPILLGEREIRRRDK